MQVMIMKNIKKIKRNFLDQFCWLEMNIKFIFMSDFIHFELIMFASIASPFLKTCIPYCFNYYICNAISFFTVAHVSLVYIFLEKEL